MCSTRVNVVDYLYDDSFQICARLDEERRNSEELRCGLEKEIEELRTKLKGSTNEVRGQPVFTPQTHSEMCAA